MKDEKAREGAGINTRKSCNNKIKRYKDPSSTSVTDGMGITDSKMYCERKISMDMKYFMCDRMLQNASKVLSILDWNNFSPLCE